MTVAQFYLEDLKTKFRKINPDEYYLSYSGGKDSHLLFWFIKEYAPEFSSIEVVGINTGLEHPEIRDRILKNCDRILLPAMKHFDIKEKYGIPCFSKIQDKIIETYQNGSRSAWIMKAMQRTILDKDGIPMPNKFCLNKKAIKGLQDGTLHKVSRKCCHYLKKKPAHMFEKESGKHPILGVRGNESILRKTSYKSCFTKDMKFTPLWDLTDELEKQIFEEFNIEIPQVYQYVTRTGCMGCPYGSYKHDTEKELALITGNQRKFICEYFKESYKVLGIEVV